MKRVILPLLSLLGALLAGGLALAGAPAAPAVTTTAAPAVGLSDSGAVTTKASEMDCQKLQDKTLGDLSRLRTEPDQIAGEKCKLSVTARANDDETVSIGEEKVKGACQATYNTINHYADVAQKKLSEVCTIVQSAHELRESCSTSQKACVSGLATKDRAAAAKLKELTTILKQAQKDLAARRKTLKAVADKYKSAFAKIDEAITKAGPSGNLQSTLTGVPNDVFSVDASNGWTALSSNGFEGSQFAKDYNHYRADVDPAFDPDAKSVPLGLGKYTQELVSANGAATDAIKTVDTAVPRVNSVAERFEQRADNLSGTSNGLGSIDMVKTANGLSSISGGARTASTALAATAASRMMPVATGLSGSLGGAKGTQNLAGGSSTAPTALTAPMPNGASDSAGSLPAANLDSAAAMAAATANVAGAAKPGTAPAAELLSAFATLGPISGGDDYDVHVAQHGRVTYVPGSRDGASSSSPLLTNAAGNRGTTAASAPSAESAAAAPASKTTDLAALRDALRRRLAERTKNGGDADASAAVEELLSASAERAPASLSESEAAELRGEQAGPQARESEPLFQRVHHAHRRFQQRLPARSVEL